MKKSKEIKALDIELLKQLENINDIVCKIKKECSIRITEEKIKLIDKIAISENLDATYLKSKFLKSKELLNNNISLPNTTDSEELLDKVEINNIIYYYENKEKGKVYNSDYIEVGVFKGNSIILNN
jgi:hypothetical protein